MLQFLANSYSSFSLILDLKQDLKSNFLLTLKLSCSLAMHQSRIMFTLFPLAITLRILVYFLNKISCLM